MTVASMTFENEKLLAEPRCPVHGQMHLDFVIDTYTCHGFDGEGCGHRVRMEDLDWIPASNIRMTGVTWT